MTDNEIIAEFMGLKFKKEMFGTRYYSVPKGHIHSHNASIGIFCYHTSWDWLMPVIAKIEKLHSEKFNYDVDKIKKGIWPEDREYMDAICMPISTPIDEVYAGVVKFIHWYNQQPK